MIKKYTIYCSRDSLFWSDIYSTNSIIKTIYYLIKAKFKKYDTIDLKISDKTD